jgi:gamma-glutamyltranspeptidase/glutathione hydrolase
MPEEIAPKPSSHSLRPVVMGTTGMVVAGTPLAAHAGSRILSRGGNAVDAAIAAALVQAVVMPHQNGFGGDMFMLYRSGKDRIVRALNASGPAPAAATRDAFIRRGFSRVPFRGVEGISVPGAVDGWFRALRAYGTLQPSDVFDQALTFAAEGFPVHQNFVRYLRGPLFQTALEVSPSLAATYLPNGEPPGVGTRLRQPMMARTIERLIRGGPEEFYRGETADHIARESARRNGLLALDDLAGFESQWVNPLSVEYRGLTVYQIPPNSQGVTMLQQLRALELFEVARLDPNSPAYIHLLVEAKKFAFADRDRYIADPDKVTVPVDDLLSRDRAESFRRHFDQRRASGGLTFRTTAPVGDTTCLAVIDGDGNSVSLIQSLFDDFGCGVFVEEIGFALQNRMCGFTLESGHANMVASYKRPLHTLCCSLVTSSDRLSYVSATPGGHAQTQALIQVLHNLMFFGMDPQEAVEAPRFSHEGDTIYLEGRIMRTRSSLTRRGHNVDKLANWSSIVGGFALITVHPGSGVMQGAADPRRDSYVVAS